MRDDALAARLRQEADRLLDFGRAARHPGGGFGWLDEHGRLDLTHPVEAWITCRMTHCYALATILGDPSTADLVDHGVHALRTTLRDERYGGWHSGTTPDKEAYAHAFVVLAAASATAAGHPDAADLLDDALSVVDERFWREADGLVVDTFSTDWQRLDPYRGANANMHVVEALLAAADVTGERLWHDRASRIVDRVLAIVSAHGGRLPEHFDERWQPVPAYNVDEPGHPFRPYGVTIGHLFEWARLAVATNAGHVERARALYRHAADRGWSADGADGFVYTTDFADRPVVRERMHWVVAEALAAAWSLHRSTEETTYLDDFRRWWQYAEHHVIDHAGGSWHHELDDHNRPSARVWSGKPDIYHAYQAMLLPLLPTAHSFVGAALTLTSR